MFQTRHFLCWKLILIVTEVVWHQALKAVNDIVKVREAHIVTSVMESPVSVWIYVVDTTAGFYTTGGV